MHELKDLKQKQSAANGNPKLKTATVAATKWWCNLWSLRPFIVVIYCALPWNAIYQKLATTTHTLARTMLLLHTFVCSLCCMLLSLPAQKQPNRKHYVGFLLLTAYQILWLCLLSHLSRFCCGKINCQT